MASSGLSGSGRTAVFHRISFWLLVVREVESGREIAALALRPDVLVEQQCRVADRGVPADLRLADLPE